MVGLPVQRDVFIAYLACGALAGLGLCLFTALAGISYANLDESSSGVSEDATESAEISWGTGLEFTALRLFGRGLPLRLGYRATDYPFEFDGSAVKESVFSGGLGFAFAANDDYPTALLEMGIEKGKRSAGVPEAEEFWRATFSLRLSGG